MCTRVPFKQRPKIDTHPLFWSNGDFLLLSFVWQKYGHMFIFDKNTSIFFFRNGTDELYLHKDLQSYCNLKWTASLTLKQGKARLLVALFPPKVLAKSPKCY